MFEGLVTMEELGSILQTLEEHPSKEEIQEMINEVDCNANGTMDFDEFLSIMAKKMKVVMSTFEEIVVS